MYLFLEVLVLDLLNVDREASAVVTVPGFDGSGHVCCSLKGVGLEWGVDLSLD